MLTLLVVLAVGNASSRHCYELDGGLDCVVCQRGPYGQTCTSSPVTSQDKPDKQHTPASMKYGSFVPNSSKPPEPDASIPAVPAASGALALTVAAFAAGRRSKKE